MGRTMRAMVALLAVSALLAGACASASAAPLDPFQESLGLGLYNSEDACALQAPATTKRCTLPRSGARIERSDGSGKYPTVPGHIISLRLRLGPVAEGTTAVEVRFRARSGPHAAAGAVGPWQSLDLGGPRLQEFPLAVPFLPGHRIAIEVIVHGDGLSEAASPIISLNAIFERDDRIAPRLRYSYSPYQDFLRTGRVYVKVRSDSAAVLMPECSLLSGQAQWGLLFDNRRLRPGGWIRFACRFYGAPLRVARKKARRGGHPLVMVHLIAYDRAGNKAAEPKLYVRAL